MDQSPLIAHPKSKLGVDDYEFYTGARLNQLVDGAVHTLRGEGVDAVVCIALLI